MRVGVIFSVILSLSWPYGVFAESRHLSCLAALAAMKPVGVSGEVQARLLHRAGEKLRDFLGRRLNSTADGIQFASVRFADAKTASEKKKHQVGKQVRGILEHLGSGSDGDRAVRTWALVLEGEEEIERFLYLQSEIAAKYQEARKKYRKKFRPIFLTGAAIAAFWVSHFPGMSLVSILRSLPFLSIMLFFYPADEPLAELYRGYPRTKKFRDRVLGLISRHRENSFWFFRSDEFKVRTNLQKQIAFSDREPADEDLYFEDPIVDGLTIQAGVGLMLRRGAEAAGLRPRAKWGSRDDLFYRDVYGQPVWVSVVRVSEDRPPQYDPEPEREEAEAVAPGQLAPGLEGVR